MRGVSLLATAVAAASFASADNCSQDAWNNYYCNEISHIKYKNVGGSGSYQRVNAMNMESGDCSFADAAYSGSLAPMDEELSLHIRGPVKLKNLAVYKPGAAATKKVKRSSHGHGLAHSHLHRRVSHPHGHSHGHQHFHDIKKREDWVTATIDGQVVSWANDYNPAAAAAPTQAADTGADDSVSAAGEGEAAQETKTTTVNLSATAPSSTPEAEAASIDSGDDDEISAAAASASTSEEDEEEEEDTVSAASSSSTGSYSRVGYYSAAAGTSDSLTFLGNYGGQGSGAFTYTFGNSLSYLSSDGVSGTSSPQVLSDVEIPSNKEFSIWSSSPCTDDSPCGFSQDDSVAYHGFSGGDKVFVLSFQMPLHPEVADDEFNADMPAIWLLNSLIPRTAQYSSCSCWTTGCGEFDIYEVLYPHDERCKSTFHTNTPGGSSDYFKRPVDEAVTVAVVFDGETGEVGVKTLSGFQFPESVSKEEVKEMLGTEAEETEEGLSVFMIST